ncbi:hypothetical protein AOZ07_02250 [Glutamicibacter halophytocola]|uniref:hypothetical protein n=1 Tax=Glutamicibacter halophytocola TaxID=1933880 RepID=UPI0006D4BE4D|nr:hypothetical protein [Glutamicibacter halophytocola]ALG27938.1 hypothetical protein AOZ07_02250 [Glutamicibacter halophytocola]
MDSPEDRRDQERAAKLLLSVAHDSRQMVKASGNPRGLLTSVIAVSAFVFTLCQAYPPRAYWLVLLYLPLIAWYALAQRGRAKPRSLINSPHLLTGAYAGYFFLCILLINCLRFWEATQVDEVLAKILVTFISAMFLVTKMQAAYNRARVEDGNDQAN